MIGQNFRTSSLDSLPDSDSPATGGAAGALALEAGATAAPDLGLGAGFWSFALAGFFPSLALDFSAILSFEKSKLYE